MNKMNWTINGEVTDSMQINKQFRQGVLKVLVLLRHINDGMSKSIFLILLYFMTTMTGLQHSCECIEGILSQLNFVEIKITNALQSDTVRYSPIENSA